MLNKIFKNQKGASLLELIIALSLFTIVILASLGIFQSILKGQRSAISSQSVQENMRYAFETMSKEIRTARKAEEGDCPNIPAGIIYQTDGSSLFFKNQYGECVSYYLVVDNNIGRLEIKRGEEDPAFVTPDEVDIKNLVFIADNESQAKITFMIDAESLKYVQSNKDIKIQTTISSRYYE